MIFILLAMDLKLLISLRWTSFFMIRLIADYESQHAHSTTAWRPVLILISRIQMP